LYVKISERYIHEMDVESFTIRESWSEDYSQRLKTDVSIVNLQMYILLFEINGIKEVLLFFQIYVGKVKLFWFCNM
jgi:hypothetical protein